MRKTSLLAGLAAAIAVGGATPARAHIDMDGALKSRGGNQKAAPCEGRPRSATPYTFEPGATITLAVAEVIPHDGYFRISFDDDGEDGFKDPQSIDPINPNRYGMGKECQGTSEDRCGESDFCNVTAKDGGPTVLWDNLDPHLGASSGRGKKWFWTVQLPNVECDNCTIQVMQVMEDPAGGAHGPFDGENDLYYRCVDIVLKKGAGGTAGVAMGTPNNKGRNCMEPAGGPTADAAVPAPADGGRAMADAGAAPAREAGGSAEPNRGDDERPTAQDRDASVGARDASSTSKPSGKDAGTVSAGQKPAGDTVDPDEDTNDNEDGDDVGSETASGSDGGDGGCSVSSVGARSDIAGLVGSLLLGVGLMITRRRR